MNLHIYLLISYDAFFLCRSVSCWTSTIFRRTPQTDVTWIDKFYTVKSSSQLVQHFHLLDVQIRELLMCRGAKTQNFPESNFFLRKNFQTKCAKPLLATNQESTYLPLTTLPKNAFSMFLCYNKIQYNTKEWMLRAGVNRKYTPSKKIKVERFQKERHGLF